MSPTALLRASGERAMALCTSADTRSVLQQQRQAGVHRQHLCIDVHKSVVDEPSSAAACTTTFYTYYPARPEQELRAIALQSH